MPQSRLHGHHAGSRESLTPSASSLLLSYRGNLNLPAAGPSWSSVTRKQNPIAAGQRLRGDLRGRRARNDSRVRLCVLWTEQIAYAAFSSPLIAVTSVCGRHGFGKNRSQPARSACRRCCVNAWPLTTMILMCCVRGSRRSRSIRSRPLRPCGSAVSVTITSGCIATAVSNASDGSHTSTASNPAYLR